MEKVPCEKTHNYLINSEYRCFLVFECRDKMACFDLKGRFYLAFKNCTSWTAQKCIFLRKTPCSFYR